MDLYKSTPRELLYSPRFTKNRYKSNSLIKDFKASFAYLKISNNPLFNLDPYLTNNKIMHDSQFVESIHHLRLDYQLYLL